MAKDSGSNEWTAAAAKKLKDKSVQDLEVMTIVNFLSEKENSEMVFQAAIDALRKKSKKAYERVYAKIAELTEQMESGQGYGISGNS